MVGKLAETVERLQLQQTDVSSNNQQQPEAVPRGGRRRGFMGQCWNCQQTGHVARNCPSPRVVRPAPQSPAQPPAQGN